MNATDDMPSACADAPRLLLVEDDPISIAYLSAALCGVPAVVDCAQTAAAARALSDLHHYDLWLLDAHLPDGIGIDLLARLRLRRPAVPALAHTASIEPALHAALLEAGFAQVLVKPLTAAALQSSVRCALGDVAMRAADRIGQSVSASLWDDESAARAMNFNRAHLDMLRTLFLQELPQAHQSILKAANSDDLASMTAGLHKLRASCGFVGAARLQRAVMDLQAAPASRAHAAAFDRIARATAARGYSGHEGGSGSPSVEDASAVDR